MGPPVAPARKRGLVNSLRQCVEVGWLALKLLWLVCFGSPAWFINFVRLTLFALALMPALLDSCGYWLRNVRKNVPYGPGLRHLLDIYEPAPAATEHEDKVKRGAPVVIFVTGGAWIIGYKAWAVPLGRALAAQGVLVIAPDYRNCPQARIDGMLQDVDRAVGWTLHNCVQLGGDLSRVVLVGQSAGAHLSALLLLRKAETEARRASGATDDAAPAWAAWVPSALAGFVGVSGPYHLEATATHWLARGFSRHTFEWIFGADGGMERNSPTCECARLLKEPELRIKLPRIRLVHGTADQSAPCVTSELLEARLRLLGVKVEPTRLYPRWSHTDPILERPFAGDHALHRDIHELLGCSAPFDADAAGCARLIPQACIDFARWVVPF
ncbi:Alpha/Beta hydrolase protein [Pelagophyceae sp. CCMP2097]|nr:Alpha/Beta hydrolase protein [Pelagophyceae sp. CCMP2097]